MSFWKILFSSAVLVTLLTSCAKEPVAESLPLSNFQVHDLIPARAVELPSTNGLALLCKRSIDDPVIASAVLFNANGEISSRMDFSTLPNVVENITFGPEDAYITDLVPMADGSFILLGLGRQTDIEDRLHLLVYRVDATGSALSAPVRRFVADKSTLVQAENLDQLYRSKALGALLSNDRLVVTVRYDRLEGPITNAYQRSYQVGLSASVGSYGSAPVQLAVNSHLLRGTLADGMGGSFTLMDATNGPGTQLTVQRTTWGTSAIAGTESDMLPLRDADPMAFRMVDNDLVIAGNYQVEADVHRPFFCRAGSPSGLGASIVFPDIGGNDHSANIAALVPTATGFNVVCNVYDRPVMSVRAMRDDLFCDLLTATLSANGALIDTQELITGSGLRALGAYGQEGEHITGAFHPFNNTEYVHCFVAAATHY